MFRRYLRDQNNIKVGRKEETDYFVGELDDLDELTTAFTSITTFDPDDTKQERESTNFEKMLASRNGHVNATYSISSLHGRTLSFSSFGNILNAILSPASLLGKQQLSPDTVTTAETPGNDLVNLGNESNGEETSLDNFSNSSIRALDSSFSLDFSESEEELPALGKRKRFEGMSDDREGFRRKVADRSEEIDSRNYFTPGLK